MIKGFTSLYCGERVCKNTPKIEALGAIDELISMLGFLRSMTDNDGTDLMVSNFALAVQVKLFSLGAIIASNSSGTSKNKLTKSDVEKLDLIVKRLEDKIEMPKGFIIPGGSNEIFGFGRRFARIPALLDVCRSLTRRVERNIISVRGLVRLRIDGASSKEIKKSREWRSEVDLSLKWINRLSDVFWLVARFYETVSWKPILLNEIDVDKLSYGF